MKKNILGLIGLVGVVVGVVLLFGGSGVSKTISPEAVFVKISQGEDIVLLDVRTPEEYEEIHLENALLLPLDQISEESLSMAGLNNLSEEIIIYCRSGNRSDQAYDIMKSLEYTNIRSMTEGMLSWQESGYGFTEPGPYVETGFGEDKDSLGLEQALIMAIEDEYKAQATYAAVLEKYGEVRPFSNIINAESSHINSLKNLFNSYEFKIPEDLWAGNVEVTESLVELCRAGVQAEIDNAALYREELIPSVSEYVDIVNVFTQLMNASQNNHLPAFQRCS